MPQFKTKETNDDNVLFIAKLVSVYRYIQLILFALVSGGALFDMPYGWDLSVLIGLIISFVVAYVWIKVIDKGARNNRQKLIDSLFAVRETSDKKINWQIYLLRFIDSILLFVSIVFSGYYLFFDVFNINFNKFALLTIIGLFAIVLVYLFQRFYLKHGLLEYYDYILSYGDTTDNLLGNKADRINFYNRMELWLEILLSSLAIGLFGLSFCFVAQFELIASVLLVDFSIWQIRAIIIFLFLLIPLYSRSPDNEYIVFFIFLALHFMLSYSGLSAMAHLITINFEVGFNSTFIVIVGFSLLYAAVLAYASSKEDKVFGLIFRGRNSGKETIELLDFSAKQTYPSDKNNLTTDPSDKNTSKHYGTL